MDLAMHCIPGEEWTVMFISVISTRFCYVIQNKNVLLMVRWCSNLDLFLFSPWSMETPKEWFLGESKHRLYENIT